MGTGGKSRLMTPLLCRVGETLVSLLSALECGSFVVIDDYAVQKWQHPTERARKRGVVLQVAVGKGLVNEVSAGPLAPPAPPPSGDIHTQAIQTRRRAPLSCHAQTECAATR